MQEQIFGSEIKIHNGKIIDSMYFNDFHEFKDEKKNTLTVFLLYPGIVSESMMIEVIDRKLKIKVYINKLFRPIYKAQNIIITGELSEPVFSNVFASKYKDGMIKIEFALIRE